MIFYKDRFGVWHKEDSFLKMAQIFCPAFPEDAVFLPKFLKETGCIKEERTIIFPSVSDYINMGMSFEAMRCYRDEHNCTLLEAREAIHKIEKDIGD